LSIPEGLGLNPRTYEFFQAIERIYYVGFEVLIGGGYKEF
jgi:hypothetical protein